MLNLKVTIIINVDGENKIMPNEVEETLRIINNDIDFHNLKIKNLDETGHYVKSLEIPSNHKETIIGCLGFAMDFHDHTISKLITARAEIMDKYDIPYDKRGEE